MRLFRNKYNYTYVKSFNGSGFPDLYHAYYYTNNEIRSVEIHDALLYGSTFHIPTIEIATGILVTIELLGTPGIPDEVFTILSIYWLCI